MANITKNSSSETIVAKTTYPLAKADSNKGGEYVTVGSIEQLSIRVNLPHKKTSVIIRGTHSYAIAMPFIPKYATTKMLKEDWDYICNDPVLSKHPSFSVKPGKKSRVFVEKSEAETIARALDSETQELATMTNTAQLTSKDLESSGLATGFNDGLDGGGVSDAVVKRMG